jgi:formylglycine-generating enzyme required for sulfatase activity
MTTDTDEAVLERLLDLVTELPPRDRPAFLDRECAGRPDLRARVLELVRHVEAADAEGLLVARPEAIVGDAASAAPTGRVGRYDLVRLLAEGGTGRVYVARHRDMGKLFAVKVLRPELAREPGAVARFGREVRVAGQLDHPNLVSATDACSDGTCYLVTELLAGATVRDLLKVLPRLPIPAACAIAGQALAGLAFLAGRGLVHRDVSPSNVFVTREGVVKLLDFGLVRVSPPGRPEDWLTGPLAVLGNPAYMAPEQYRTPRAVDPRADLYGLGCLLYHMLTGAPPFHEAGPVDPVMLLERHAAEARPTPIAELRPDVPAEVASLVDGLLSRDPAARPGPAESAAEVLRPFADGSDLSALVATVPSPPAPPDTMLAPGPAPRRTRRWLLGAAAAVVLAGLLVAFWPWADRDEPGPGPAPEPDTARTLHGIAFRVVPPGTFVMGTEVGQGPANESPVRQVTLTRPFWMAVDPVTVGQFRRFVEATSYETSAEKHGQGRRRIRRPDGKERWVADPEVMWETPGFDQTAAHPVVCVSWDDAMAYCAWLTAADPEFTFRLPTEAEWEYACRAGASTAPAPTGIGTTRPADDQPTNTLGLRGMLGNVYQWVGDEYAPYPPGDAVDPFVPPRPPDPDQPATRTRVCRGGGPGSPPRFCRPAVRVPNVPDYASQGVGFRVVGVGR